MTDREPTAVPSIGYHNAEARQAWAVRSLDAAALRRAEEDQWLLNQQELAAPPSAPRRDRGRLAVEIDWMGPVDVLILVAWVAAGAFQRIKTGIRDAVGWVEAELAWPVALMILLIPAYLVLGLVAYCVGRWG